MAVITEDNKRTARHLAESASLNMINEEIVVASGAGILKAGTVLGRYLNGTPTVTPGTPASGSGQTVGNGAVGAWTADANMPDGEWSIVITNEAANAGQFKVVRPDGTIDGYGTVAVAYNGGINGTLADGGNDWKEDDRIPMVVAYATKVYRYVLHDAALTNGAQNAAAVLYATVDATSADADGVATVRGPATLVLGNLTFKTGISAANKAAAVEALKNKGMIPL